MMKCFARKNCVVIVDEHGYEVGIISTNKNKNIFYQLSN